MKEKTWISETADVARRIKVRARSMSVTQPEHIGGGNLSIVKETIAA